MLHFGPANFGLRMPNVKYMAFCSFILNAIWQYVKSI